MIAESVEHRVHWPVPPQDGYCVDDLFTLPDLPPHTELIDGSLIFVSPQRNFHALVLYVLEHGLRATAPDEFRVRREMTVVLDNHNAPEPDISVVRAEADAGLEQTRYQARDVHLAVEVVSPDSKSRDRTTKPVKYAAAGIPNFWRIERDGSRTVVHVYELDTMTRAYVHMGVHRDRIKVDKPYAIDIDLTAIDKL
ncbi:Putative restriction endonuclease [Streptomyces yunnanensis]|uniref:Restriction endonuclease n=3 Tax=Streptomyces TaxID=1883 RepID=A0A9X8MM26_9ACTN|nr:hypothetical protein AOB60_20070 [Streptomyces noursei]SHL06064.1 Putative restriction endonuclease [Streptomyces yunnanensis]